MNQGIQLYIDPGTGAMLFTVIMGVVTTLLFSVQKLWLKVKFAISGGSAAAKSADKMGIVIFSDHKRYWNVFEPVCDELEKRKMVCHFWTASPDDPALEKAYQYVKCEFIGEGNKAFARLNIMKADICLSTTPGLDVYQWRRSKNVGCYVHIPHDVGELTGYRMFGLDYYDAVILPGTMQEKDLRELEALRHLPEKEMLTVGSTYMDELKKKAGAYPDRHEGTTVLVAPSWGESSILNRYGAAFLKQLKETGYRIIVRPHPQSRTSDPKLLEQLMKEFPDDELWSWNFDNDNFAVLSRSDLLISDFSGVLFDFAFIFQKPVIYADTHLDKSPYDSCWIEEEPWKLRILPSMGRQLKEEDFPHMRKVIDETIANETYAAGRARAMDEAWCFRGEAAVRVADYLMEKLAKANGGECSNVL